MNSDSFAVIVGGAGRNQLVALTGLGTTETVFTMGTDASSAGAFVAIPSQSAIVGSSNSVDPGVNSAKLVDQYGSMGDRRNMPGRPWFTSGDFSGRAFRLRSSGYFTTSNLDATTGHAINLYVNSAANGAVVAGATQIGTFPTSATLAAGNYNFVAEATMIWDSVSSRLMAEAWAINADTYTARALKAMTGINILTSVFFATVKFNNGAANTITPIELSLERA